MVESWVGLKDSGGNGCGGFGSGRADNVNFMQEGFMGQNEDKQI